MSYTCWQYYRYVASYNCVGVETVPSRGTIVCELAAIVDRMTGHLHLFGYEYTSKSSSRMLRSHLSKYITSCLMVTYLVPKMGVEDTALALRPSLLRC